MPCHGKMLILNAVLNFSVFLCFCQCVLIFSMSWKAIYGLSKEIKKKQFPVFPFKKFFYESDKKDAEVHDDNFLKLPLDFHVETM